MKKLKIKANKGKSASAWKPIMVSSEMFAQLDELTDKAGLRKCDIVEKLLTFALERVEIVESE